MQGKGRWGGGGITLGELKEGREMVERGIGRGRYSGRWQVAGEISHGWVRLNGLSSKSWEGSMGGACRIMCVFQHMCACAWKGGKRQKALPLLKALLRLQCASQKKKSPSLGMFSSNVIS